MHHRARLFDAVLLSRIIWTDETQARGMKRLDATQCRVTSAPFDCSPISCSSHHRVAVKEAPDEPKAHREAVQCMRINSLLRLQGDIHEDLKIIEPE